MSTRDSTANAIRDGVPFVAIMAFWIAVTAVVYGAFVVIWPEIPDAEPWIHLGVYLLPIIGFFGHVLHQALKPR